MEDISKETVLKKIDEEVKSHKVLLYVKGTKEQPMCGFSATAVSIFKQLGKPFDTVDILANPDRRQFVPEYSQWPTFPQVFIGGEFVGGCDIVHELYEQGELQKLLDKTFTS